MKRHALSCGLLTAFLYTFPSHAEVPAYVGTELQARSNLIVNDNGFNVPPGTSFNSISASLNDAGEVTFTAGVVPINGNLSQTGAGLWVGGHGAGEFVAIHESGSEEGSVIISDRPGINAHGDVAYYTSDDGGPYVLRKYDAVAGTSSALSVLPLTPTSFQNPEITDDGLIGFKGRMGLGYGIGTTLGNSGSGVLYAVDTNVDPGSGYAYLYSPATDNAGRIAVKASTSSYSHNEIRLFDGPNGNSRVVANQTIDAQSPFADFDNGLGLNDGGAVAVVVKLAAGNVRAVYRFAPGASGIEATEIARVDAAGTIRAIDSFAPAINNNGLVVFRGSDANGQAVFAGDGKSLVRVIGKGDVVPTDMGPGQLGQHDSSQVFSGAPTVNGYGDIAFVSGLHPEGNNQVEWGSGVFVAYAERPVEDDTIFRDGFEEAAAE